jgi:predicted nucleic acid-binding protein
MMSAHSVLLDTSFFLRFLNTQNPLHGNAMAYFKYFLDHDFILKISTIAMAEFCVAAAINDLPLLNLQIVPFNYNHAIKAGEFMRVVFNHRKQQSTPTVSSRVIIPNDTKMFAQADVEQVESFVSSDTEAQKIFAIINKVAPVHFNFIDINTPCHQTYGRLFPE